MPNVSTAAPLGGAWPEPRVRALEVEEIYRNAGTASGFSYFGALLVLGVLVHAGDIARAAIWFVWATAVTVLRFGVLVAYRQREANSDPEPWARLVILANLLAGIQWGVLGTLLYPEEPGYRQAFVVMVIICFVSGSVTAYAAVRGAHEALAVPAAIPTAVYIFFLHDGVHWLPGIGALFFCFAILYYAARTNRQIVEGYRLQVERDELLELTGVLNDKLQRENRDLAHRAAMRGASVASARERAGRLEALFENAPLPKIECDAAGNVVTLNLAAERLFGVRHGEIAGRPFSSLLAPGEPAPPFSGLAAPRSAWIVVRDGQGRPRRCIASVTPLPPPEGMKPGFAIILSGLEELAEVK